jgi:DMSO/TMAO reductase YedYZ molybdopterin-dependent catalytic subunit
MNRRFFLQQSAVATLGITFLPLLNGCEDNSVAPITNGFEIDFLTPQNKLFIKQGAEISIPNWQQPNISTADWRLSINGLVNTAKSISYADLMAERSAGRSLKILKTMRCVIDSNDAQGLIGTGVWEGIPLKTFLDQAGVQAATKRFRIYGADTFTNNLKYERIYGTLATDLFQPILVTHFNGEPLSAAHGAPVRLMLNESFGFKNVKWINRVEATADDSTFGTYQAAGFVDDGVMRTNSRMTNPLNRAILPAGNFRLSGFAVSGAAPIQKVEIQIDGGAWQTAQLTSFTDLQASYPQLTNIQQLTAGQSYPFRGVWVKWTFDWNAVLGNHNIKIRATDTAGNTQTDTDTVISDGINAIAQVEVQVG